MADEETIKVYDERVNDYAAIVTKDEVDPALQAFVDHMPGGGRVLDLGCGVGNAAAFFRDNGLLVDAYDASAEMVRFANKTHNIGAEQKQFDDLNAIAVYDGIWANFSLLHAKKDDFPRHLNQIKNALKPNGLFHIGMKLGSGEFRDKIGRQYAYYSEEELRRFYSDLGFEIIWESHGEEPGLSGENWPWVTLLGKLTSSQAFIAPAGEEGEAEQVVMAVVTD